MTVNAMFFWRINTVCAALYDSLPGLPRDLCFIQIPRVSSVLEILGWSRSSKYWMKEAESQIQMVLKKKFKEIKRTANEERAVYRKIPVHRTSWSF